MKLRIVSKPFDGYMSPAAMSPEDHMEEQKGGITSCCCTCTCCKLNVGD